MTASAAPDQAQMRRLATAISAGRAGIGLAVLLAPRTSSRVLGFPLDQDNPTARLAGRLFGVRELALAGYTARQVQQSAEQPEVYALNAAVDAADTAVLGLTLLGRRGLGRAMVSSLLLSIPFATVWLWLRGSCQD